MAPFAEEKSVQLPEIPLDLKEAWVLPGELNTTKNCAGCIEGLTTMPGETNVRSIALLSPFDRAQRPVCGEKAGQVTLNTTSIQRRRCFQVSYTR